MARLNERIAAIEAQLADPAVYQDREKLDAILVDRAYAANELAQIESEWLQKQAELEQP
jgi:ATP-binding cassette subfamily F protein 3